MKERYLSKTPFLTFVYISKCNINLPGYFGNSKKRFLWTGLMPSFSRISEIYLKWKLQPVTFAFFLYPYAFLDNTNKHKYVKFWPKMFDKIEVWQEFSQFNIVPPLRGGDYIEIPVALLHDIRLRGKPGQAGLGNLAETWRITSSSSSSPSKTGSIYNKGRLSLRKSYNVVNVQVGLLQPKLSLRQFEINVIIIPLYLGHREKNLGYFA